MRKHLYSLFAFALFLFTFLNLQVLFFPENEAYQKLKANLLEKPFAAESHQKMADFWEKRGERKKAYQELKLTEPSILGDFVNEEKETERKLRYWEKIVLLHPDYRDGYFQLAVLEFRNGDLVRAKKNLQKTLRVDPNFSQALELKGRL